MAGVQGHFTPLYATHYPTHPTLPAGMFVWIDLRAWLPEQSWEGERRLWNDICDASKVVLTPGARRCRRRAVSAMLTPPFHVLDSAVHGQHLRGLACFARCNPRLSPRPPGCQASTATPKSQASFDSVLHGLSARRLWKRCVACKHSWAHHPPTAPRRAETGHCMDCKKTIIMFVPVPH